MKKIELTRGQMAIVDDEDFDELNKYKWFAAWNSCTKSFYATRQIRCGSRQRALRMNRVILGLEFGDKRQGDHVNLDTLDNRKGNLRVATHQQNMLNRSIFSTNKSGFKRVSLKNSINKWAVQYRLFGKNNHVGYFNSKVDAAQIYMLISYMKHGEFSRLS